MQTLVRPWFASASFLACASATREVSWSADASLGVVARAAGCQEGTEDPPAIDCVFERLYQGSIWGESTDDTESAARSFTYGEVTALGVQTLLENVAHAGAPLGPDDSFADLGSGMGRAVLQVRLATPVSRSIGVE